MYRLTTCCRVDVSDDELSSRSATNIGHEKIMNSAVSVMQSAVISAARQSISSTQTTEAQRSQLHTRRRRSFVVRSVAVAPAGDYASHSVASASAAAAD